MNNVLLTDDNAEDTVLEKVNEYVASDRLRVLCANVDTLTNKMDEFPIRVFSENPDVIFLQDVLPKNAYGEIEVEIDLKINGYDMFKVNDRVCLARVFITYKKLYMYIASIVCKTNVTSVLYH